MTTPLGPPFYPPAELVMKAWLLGISGVDAAGAAADLPRDQESWAANGFVTYAVIGGALGRDVPMRAPVFQVDCWAVSPSSGKPPWGKANQLAEHIAADCYARPGNAPQGRRRVALGANYLEALVHAAQVRTEPRRLRSDDGSYARYQMDVQLWFTEVPA